MTSDNPSTPSKTGTRQAQDDLDQTRDRVRTEAQSAKDEARNAADSIRDAASDLSGKARARAREEGEKGKEQAAGSLDDFAAAVRKASDELGERDQSMASSLVREVAGGLEQASRTIHGKDIGEITQSVARFARERPATFLVGAALAGLALGRFARSSGEHDQRDYAGGGGRDGGSGDMASGDRSYSPAGSRVPAGYRPSYSDQPRPTEGAFPRDRDPVTGTARGVGAAPSIPERPAGETSSASRATAASPLSRSTNPTSSHPSVKGENHER